MLSFINGVIAGAGIMLAIMSIVFLQIAGPLVEKLNLPTTEIRVAIFLGFIVCVIAVLYEFYVGKNAVNQNTVNNRFSS